MAKTNKVVANILELRNEIKKTGAIIILIMESIDGIFFLK
jgi:hypothetical protein